MTGTKVVKLRLEDDGKDLPKLKGSVIDEAVELFEKIDWENNLVGYHEKVLKKTRRLDANSAAVQGIVYQLEDNFAKGDMQDKFYFKRMGAFLTGLIENSTSEELEFETRTPLDYIGYLMNAEKTITVNGAAGDMTGYMMRRGLIRVKGDSGFWTGCQLAGGKVEVEGSTGEYTGQQMETGEITVKKDAGRKTGLRMKGGRIEVGGSIGDIGPVIKGGEIYNKGERVWPK
ncbi:MAG: hypothetical protein V1921_06400 [Candidatus Altiarchaeota archaeon]